MIKTKNEIVLLGRVYSTKFEHKITGANSKQPGTEYFKGTIDIATDDEGLNVVRWNFMYQTAKTKKGGVNSNFPVLKTLYDSGSTWMKNGIGSAPMVRLSSAVGSYDNYNTRNGQMFSAPQISEGFISLIDELPDDMEQRNKFKIDAVVNKIAERDDGGVIMTGFTFDFRGAMVPLQLVATEVDAMTYFMSQEIGSAKPFFTQFVGHYECNTVTEEEVVQSAFGPEIHNVVVKAHNRNFIIDACPAIPYMIGDGGDVTVEELQKAVSLREIALAKIIKDREDYANSSAAASSQGNGFSTAAPVAATPTAATAPTDSGFKF